MQSTREQFELIAPLLPRQSGNVRLANLAVGQHHLVCRGQWLQVARATGLPWLLAQHLHAHEPRGQGQRAQCGV